MPGLRQAGKNLSRLRQISAVIARHGFGDILERARLFERLGIRPKTEVSPEERRKSTAERFRTMLTDLGPTFVKFGQVLSTRPDLLPPDFVRELSKLQDQAPELPLEVVREVVEKGLGRRVAELYADIDEKALASASIAQVHAAHLKDGREVVVKVQRPGITESIRADLDLLYYLAQFLERVIEETGIYTPTGIVEEFEKSLFEELDFLHEAANVQRFVDLNAGRAFIKIPEVFHELSCRTVLTLERLRGEKITAPDATFDRKKVAKNLVDAVFTSVFVDGVFHADPHPGNVFVLEGGRIGLVDFGLVGHVSRQMQETIILLMLAIVLKDPDTVTRLLYKVGIPDTRVNLSQFRHDASDILDRYLGLELAQVQSARLIDDIVSLALKYRIKVPKEYALLTKAGVALEGVVRTIAPDMDVLEVALPYAKRLLFERLSPRSASGGLLRALLQLEGLLTEVPLQLSQVLLDLEGGKFAVNVKAPELPQLVQALKWLGIVVFSGLTASALIIGSFELLAQSKVRWQIHGIPALSIVGLVLASTLFGGALAWTLISGRIHKISLRKLFGRRS